MVIINECVIMTSHIYIYVNLIISFSLYYKRFMSYKFLSANVCVCVYIESHLSLSELLLLFQMSCDSTSLEIKKVRGARKDIWTLCFVNSCGEELSYQTVLVINYLANNSLC